MGDQDENAGSILGFAIYDGSLAGVRDLQSYLQWTSITTIIFVAYEP